MVTASVETGKSQLELITKLQAHPEKSQTKMPPASKVPRVFNSQHLVHVIYSAHDSSWQPLKWTQAIRDDFTKRKNKAPTHQSTHPHTYHNDTAADLTTIYTHLCWLSFPKTKAKNIPGTDTNSHHAKEQPGDRLFFYRDILSTNSRYLLSSCLE